MGFFTARTYIDLDIAPSPPIVQIVTYIPSGSRPRIPCGTLAFSSQYLRVYRDCMDQGFSSQDAREYAQMEVEALRAKATETRALTIADFCHAKEPIVISTDLSVPSRLDESIEDGQIDETDDNELGAPEGGALSMADGSTTISGNATTGDSVVIEADVIPFPLASNPPNAPKQIKLSKKERRAERKRRAVDDSRIPNRVTIPSFVQLPKKRKQLKRFEQRWGSVANQARTTIEDVGQWIREGGRFGSGYLDLFSARQNGQTPVSEAKPSDGVKRTIGDEWPGTISEM